jgi:hypothetical protein
VAELGVNRHERWTPMKPFPVPIAQQRLSGEERLQEAGAGLVPQPGKGALLDLADALAGDAEALADLLQGQWLGLAEAEVEPEHLRFAFAERAESVVDGAGKGLGVELFVRARREVVADVVEQLAFLPRNERRVQREVCLRHREGMLDLVFRKLQLLRDLLEGWLATELLRQE